MLKIRPITDLRNNFADISKTVHENHNPVILTKNGYGDMVVMSIEAFEKLMLDNKIVEKLRNSSIEAKESKVRYDFDEVAKEMRRKLVENL